MLKYLLFVLIIVYVIIVIDNPFIYASHFLLDDNTNMFKRFLCRNVFFPNACGKWIPNVQRFYDLNTTNKLVSGQAGYYKLHDNVKQTVIFLGCLMFSYMKFTQYHLIKMFYDRGYNIAVIYRLNYDFSEDSKTSRTIENITR